MPGLAAAFLAVPIGMGCYGYWFGGRKCGFVPGQLSTKVVSRTMAAVLVLLVAGWWVSGLQASGGELHLLGRIVQFPCPEVWWISGTTFAVAVFAGVRALLGFRGRPATD